MRQHLPPESRQLTHKTRQRTSVPASIPRDCGEIDLFITDLTHVPYSQQPPITPFLITAVVG